MIYMIHLRDGMGIKQVIATRVHIESDVMFFLDRGTLGPVALFPLRVVEYVETDSCDDAP